MRLPSRRGFLARLAAFPLLLERAHKVTTILQSAGILPSDHVIPLHDLIHAEYLPVA